MGRKASKDIDFSKMKKVKYVNRHISKRPYLYLNYEGRILLFVVLIAIMAVLSYVFINKSFAIYNVTKLEYSENGNVNYSISLKDNEFYNSSTLGSGRRYISSLIDNIETTFKYNSFFSDKLIVNYNYYIEGKLYIYSSDGNVLFDETYPMLDKVYNETFSNKVNINQEMVIDYEKYNNIALNYVNQYGEGVRSELVVSMIIGYEGAYGEFYNTGIHHDTKVVMTIPLMEDSIVINVNDKYLDDNGEYSEVNLTSGMNKLYSYMGSGMLILATILSIYLISFIIGSKPKKSKYSKLRDSYLKEYDRLIVNTKTLPKFNDSNVIDCYNFNELMDAEEILELPINYYEIVKDQKCVFYIVNGKDVYKYVLKDCDLEY